MKKYKKFKKLIKNLREISFDLVIFCLDKMISNSNHFVLGADGGKRYADNTRYFFEWLLLEQNEIAYWITIDKSIKKFSDKLSNKKLNEHIIYRWSLKGIWLIARSKYVICSHSTNGSDVCRFINKTKKLISLYHATPFKKMPFTPKCKIRKFIGAKYQPDLFIIQSPCEVKIYSEAYELKKDIFALMGYPRVVALALNYNPEPYILWCPTFRDNMDQEYFEENVYPKKEEWKAINEYLLKTNQRLIIKEHPYSTSSPAELIDGLDMIEIGSKSKDINFYLSKASLLITDYSSVFFDFLSIGGKVNLFAPDLNWYKDTSNRGLMPGYIDIIRKNQMESLIKAISKSSPNLKNDIINLLGPFKRVNKNTNFKIYERIKSI